MELKPTNVLIAYDGSELSQFADAPEEERQREALAEAKALLAESGIDARSDSPVGDEAAEIVRVAGEAGADIIVLGARGLNPLKRLVLGSVSTKVLHQAPCDVLVVK